MKKPNFSGTYAFNAKKSKLQIPAPTSATFTIVHQDPAFHLTRTLVFDSKSDTWGIDLTTDGKEIVKKEKDRTLHCKCFWDGTDLVFDTKIILADKEATNVVKYHLSEDGKTFTAAEKFRGPALQYDNLWVFDKK